VRSKILFSRIKISKQARQTRVILSRWIWWIFSRHTHKTTLVMININIISYTEVCKLHTAIQRYNNLTNLFFKSLIIC